MKSKIPIQYSGYQCIDYFEGLWMTCGYFDEASQTMLIVPLHDAYEVAESGFFAVGRSGGGGIDFGYRKTHRGLWAFYPIEQEFKFMAESIHELVDGWCAGQLAV